MDKLQETPPSTSYQIKNSVPPKTFKSRISSLFHKSENFEKKFSKRLDKIIPLSIGVYTHSEKYEFIKASLARNTIQISDEDAYRERAEKVFIKRFETIYNREQRSMDTLLSLIKTNEDLNKALQMIDNRFESTADPVKQLGIAKIKEVIHKTFHLQEKQSESTKKIFNPNKFVPTLPSIIEEEEPRIPVIIHSTKL